MNDLTPHPDFIALITEIQQLEDELAELVNERDELLFHICPKLQTEYILKIGKIEYAIFEYQCNILRIKRKIEIIQSFKNREQTYNLEEIDKQLEKEYQVYTEKLIEKQKEIESARLKESNYGRVLTEEETTELKKLYTTIVKQLHPDINPDLTEEKHGHFIDAVNAFKKADLSEMRVIYLLLEKTTGDVVETINSMDKLKERKDLLLRERGYLENTIKKIKMEFPYNIKLLIIDSIKLQEKINELSNQLTDLQEQHNSIEKRLKELTEHE